MQTFYHPYADTLITAIPQGTGVVFEFEAWMHKSTMPPIPEKNASDYVDTLLDMGWIACDPCTVEVTA